MASADIEKSLLAVKAAGTELRKLSTESKNRVLLSLADLIVAASSELILENQKDIHALPPDTKPAFRDRLTLTPQRVLDLAESLRQVAKLPDPVNELVEERRLPNGLRLRKVRAPLGVIFMIFESRPNVIIEAFSLAWKSGNAIILRGGSESKFTNAAIFGRMNQCLKNEGISFSAFYGFEDYDRQWVESLLKRKDLIDVVVPRGGDKLIQMVQEKSLMPIIKNDRGLCHTYVDDEADLQMAADIVKNAKTQRPGVCNSLETVLVHQNIASAFLPLLRDRTQTQKLQWRVDGASLQILPADENIQLANSNDWDTEHLDLIMNCKIVKDMDEALKHIADHGSKHSEAIVTQSEPKARRFQDEIDAAATYWNASTRFTDGFEFGLGGELGISTQKLHVRGPVGLRELTTPRWIIDGQGQIRN